MNSYYRVNGIYEKDHLIRSRIINNDTSKSRKKKVILLCKYLSVLTLESREVSLMSQFRTLINSRLQLILYIDLLCCKIYLFSLAFMALRLLALL